MYVTEQSGTKHSKKEVTIVCCPDYLQHRIGVRIKTLNHVFARKLFEVAQENGLDQISLMHGRIVGFLYLHQGENVCQRDIEEAFHITRSSVSGIVKLMEEKGYITRQAVQGDARLKRLALTPLGVQFHKESFAFMQTVENLAVQGMSQEQLDTFLSLCDIIQENLTKKECSHAENHCIPD